MHDPRYDQLAKVLVEYSTRLKRNETVLIETFDVPDEMTISLVRAAREAGAIPFAQIYRARLNRELALERLQTRLAAALHVEAKRFSTKQSRSSKKRRVDEKKRHGDIKRNRRPPSGEE